jgi:hypothetical protein
VRIVPEESHRRGEDDDEEEESSVSDETIFPHKPNAELVNYVTALIDGAVQADLSGIDLDNVKDIVATLIRTVEKRVPTQCVECDEPLNERLTKRCVKHMASALAGDFTKSKIREHGPAIMAKGAMAIQGWLEKFADESPEGKSQ